MAAESRQHDDPGQLRMTDDRTASPKLSPDAPFILGGARTPKDRRLLLTSSAPLEKLK